MLHIMYAPEDSALGERLKADFVKAGYEVDGELPHETGHILIPIISKTGNADQGVQATIIRALDNSQHIIPVVVEKAGLPKLIAHLSSADFSDDYDFKLVRKMVDAASAPGAGQPLRVLTPTVRASNQRIGMWLAIIVVLSFIVGVVLVGFFGIQAPREEYNSIDTLAAVTIQALIAPNLPHSTEDAANFPATLQAAPTAQRPLLIGTATRQAEQNSLLP